MGAESEDDFGNLFADLDLTSHKLENLKPKKRTDCQSPCASRRNWFWSGNTDSDVLGDAYEYLIGQFASGAGKKAGEFYTHNK
jgi:type I restriction enzyme M protein